MNAMPPDFHAAFSVPVETGALAQRWVALAGAARIIAQLAGLSRQSEIELAVAPPPALSLATGKRQALVDQAIDDLLAVMEPGLTALLNVHQRGGVTTPAAMALWQEFLRARDGLSALAPLG